MLPAALGIAVTALPVCRALFEHGKFLPEQSLSTARSLFWLALGLPAYGLNKVAASSLYAMRRQKAPIIIISAQLTLNALLCLPLMRSIGAPGLMLATSISSWTAALAFIFVLNREAGFSPMAIPLFRPALAAALSALAALALREVLDPAGPLVVTAVAVPAGVAVYFSALKVLKVEERNLLTGGRF